MPNISAIDLDSIFSMGDSICASVQNNRTRGAQNTTLISLSTNPEAVLLDYGMPPDLFDNALPSVKAEFIQMVKDQALSDLALAGRGVHPRGYWRCWACFLGIGAVIVAVGAAITYATFGTGTAAFTFIVTFVGRWLAQAAATAVVTGLTAGGAFVVAGTITAIVTYICQQIPDTCEA